MRIPYTALEATNREPPPRRSERLPLRPCSCPRALRLDGLWLVRATGSRQLIDPTTRLQPRRYNGEPPKLAALPHQLITTFFRCRTGGDHHAQPATTMYADERPVKAHPELS